MNPHADEATMTEAEIAAMDSAAVAIATRIVEKGLWDQVWSTMTPEERASYETAETRHAARMRADGHPGW